MLTYLIYFVFWICVYVIILIILGVLTGYLKIGKSVGELSRRLEYEYHRREHEQKRAVGECNGRAQGISRKV